MEAVSAALGPIGPLLGKLTGLLANEFGRLKGVGRRQIRYLRSDLTDMYAALQEYTKWEDPGDQVKMCISLLRELSYDIEDVFDKFIHHLRDNRDHGGFKECFGTTARSLKKLGARRGIAGQIDELKARINEVKELKSRYKQDDIPSSTSGHAVVDPRLHAVFAEEAQLVGLEGPRDALVKWMVEEDSNSFKHRKVLSIVGFGGLGKTTLANEVYHKIRGEFNCGAFVSVSQKPNVKKIIKDVISQVQCQDGPIKDIDIWDEMTSIAKLRELLQDKRYMVIIDDVWSTQAWHTIKCAFPENNCSSRIIITTRIMEVARSCCSGGDDRVYEMEPLSDLQSKRLFLKRIFGSEDHCPDMLKEVSNKILKKCGGLPLAIISISGLLANKPAVKEEWEKVKRSIGSALEKNKSLEGMSNILSLSYNDLPPNLMTCLLYLSVFPEDYVIDRERLVRRWIAEGFIREERGQSRQEVAENYFYELINKSVVQPVDIGYDGKVRACRVHGMMLEIIISKSVEHNFVTVVGGDQASLTNRHGIRRLSIQHIDQELASALANEDLRHVRSLTVASSVCLNQLPSLDEFEALRVLEFEDCEGLEEYITNGMDKLFKLKYLSLRGKIISKLPPAIMMLPDLAFLDLSDTDISTLQPEIRMLRGLEYLNLSGTGISELPPEIAMLHKLEYLDLSGTGISELPPKILMLIGLQYLDLRDTRIEELPAGIAKLFRLKHLHISSETWSQKGKIKIQDGMGSMSSLQAMSGFNITDSSVGAVEELGNLTGLGELSIQLNHGGSEQYKKHEEMLLSSLCKLGTYQLMKLWIHTCRGSLEFLNSWSPLPSSLRIFCVSGDSCFRNIPKWIAPALTNLLHLEIRITELREEELHTLGELPALLDLKLSLIADPVERITVQGVGFPNLKKFVIYNVAGLYITFTEGAMPKLEKLSVRLNVSLAKYSGFELGIQHLPCLGEATVSLYTVDVTPFEIKAAAAVIRKEARVHPNRPTIDISGQFSENHSEISSDEEDLR